MFKAKLGPKGPTGPRPQGTLGPGPKGANWARTPNELEPAEPEMKPEPAEPEPTSLRTEPNRTEPFVSWFCCFVV